MDVRCERCATEYELDDDSVPAGGCPVQCTTCGHTFNVQRASAPAVEHMPSPPAADWLLETSDGRLHRFRNLTSLQKWIIERKVTREDKISRTGQAWRRLGEIVELAPFFDVVDEADRARAAQAGLQHAELKVEAERARRVGSARPSPASARPAAAPSPLPVARSQPSARRPSSSQELASLDAWSSTQSPVEDATGEFDTSVVPLQRRAGRIVAGLLVAALLAVGAVFAVSRYGAASKVGPGAADLRPQPTREAAPVATTDPAKPETPPVAVALEPVVTPPPGPTTAPTGGRDPAPVKPLPEPGEAPASYDKLVAEADRLLENGATDRAIKLYERAIKQQPGGVDALAGMGYAMLDKNRTGLALGFFEQALRQAPSFGPALFGLAEALRAQGNDARAMEGYQRYLQVNGSGADAPAARRQLRLLEDKLGSAEPSKVVSPVPTTPPPSPSSVLNESAEP